MFCVRDGGSRSMALIAEKEFDGNHPISMDGYHHLLMDGSDSDGFLIDIFSSR